MVEQTFRLNTTAFVMHLWLADAPTAKNNQGLRLKPWPASHRPSLQRVGCHFGDVVAKQAGFSLP